MKLTTNCSGLNGSLSVPGDKSISHRSIMFGAVSQGTTTIHNFLRADDCLGTMEIFKQLGVPIEDDGETITVTGVGFAGLTPPETALDVGNSGTTIRLLMGVLAGSPHTYTLTGDESIQKRPMNRVMLPLNEMGAACSGKDGSEFPPITLTGNSALSPISYQLPVASAQVKSALLFAALQSTGESVIIEKAPTRDHTEEMIRQFGGRIAVDGKEIRLSGPQQLTGQTVIVPGDISSAAFFIAAALLIPDSVVTVTNVGLSHSRSGIIDVVRQMGGDIEISDQDDKNQSGTLTIRTSQLNGIEIGGDIIPRLIDEIPVIALLATQAKGRTVIRDAEELKVKETDRIAAVTEELNALGARITATDDGMIIEGATALHSGRVSSHGDHRIGMMLQIAALLVSDGPVALSKAEAVSVSYPDFFQDLATLF
ncbi:3-phosphoshikimate 1-carboxyvinyltransferase [Vagococcus acidifermentans]|uniref:3-phosphoshikimate 1-carboxyvinyltransferase n=1 Tax=Vagococcus acidifermentans TaxID=564710 RepID=A0A430AMG1_9ENTE|nr:3-phosphoshikimate 1-carboxyvinyltransferase [Vagococcus acidifermentans]RSU09308.1 3-phosphoshikimate 1-carboxyvinyltransferase [Vagococcus acidifermentans]